MTLVMRTPCKKKVGPDFVQCCEWLDSSELTPHDGDLVFHPDHGWLIYSLGRWIGHKTFAVTL